MLTEAASCSELLVQCAGGTQPPLLLLHRVPRPLPHLEVHQGSLWAFATQHSCVFVARAQRQRAEQDPAGSNTNLLFQGLEAPPPPLPPLFPSYSPSIPRVRLTERGGARRTRMVALNRSTQLSVGMLAPGGRRAGFRPLTPLVRNQPRLCRSSVACGAGGREGGVCSDSQRAASSTCLQEMLGIRGRRALAQPSGG